VDFVASAALTVVTQVEAWATQAAEVYSPALALSYAVGTFAVAWHRQLPMTALAVALTGLSVVPGAMGIDPAFGVGWFLAAFTVMVSAGYHARWPLAALATALGLIGFSVVVEKGWAFGDIAYAWFLSGAAWLGGRALATRTLRAQLSEERALVAEQQARWRASAAVAEERLRIARELHDVVSHSVTVMNLHVSGVRRRLEPDQAEERATLEMVERTGREALGEMRRMLNVLRGPGGDGPGASSGLDRLPDLLEQARSAGIEVDFTIDGEPRPVAPGIAQAVYRVAQEALTNVIRHAAARRMTCRLGYGRDSVELTIADDGRGADPGARDGHGLVGMRERAALYGGTVSAGPRPGDGFEVRLALPAPEPAQVAVDQGTP
jgi:signal transduction histidine kinase